MRLIVGDEAKVFLRRNDGRHPSLVKSSYDNITICDMGRFYLCVYNDYHTKTLT